MACLFANVMIVSNIVTYNRKKRGSIQVIDGRTPMKLLIIEDVDAERKRFLEYAKTCPDKIQIVGSTNSSRRGLEVMHEINPDGIILDLELKYGIGSGIEFLESLKKGRTDGTQYTGKKPIIVVTTQNPSEVVHNVVRKYGVDYIFYKGQGGYCPQAVISVMLLFRAPSDFTDLYDDTENKVDITEKDDIMEVDNFSETKKLNRIKVINLINKELDAIGMGRHYKGRIYIVSAITILLDDTLASSDAAFKKTAEEHSLGYSSIMRAITTAIENTWYDCDPDVLKHQYPLHISDKKARPTNSEFIYYYSEKIIKLMKEEDD
jgi:CheY-like chemotaxis protein